MNHAGNAMTGGVICDQAKDGDSIYDLRGSTDDVDCPACKKFIEETMAEIKREQEHG